MAFNSFPFWIVFPFIFGIYWSIPPKCNQWRKVFLVLASYLLYMNWKPAIALVLLGVTLVTYFGGHVLEAKDETKKRKRRIAWMFALLGLLPLLTFKYYNFLNESLTAGLSAIGLKLTLPGLNWAVPVGISFFTFQAIGYMLDVYHGRVKAERNLLDYVLFVSFFPQVTSGPISTAEDLMPQIKATHTFNYEQGKQGLKQLLWGMFIKLVIADRLGMYVDTVFANYIHYSGSTCFFASLFYTLQIYCDFAGYSLMAIGIAKTLGFNLIDNFRHPYFAVSITDFWKRWHISLTRWLTRQVYIPLGGSRCSKARTYWNIFITFFVSGIWHGANWTFIVWGVMHGTLQVIEKALGWQKYEGKNMAVRLVRIVMTVLLVNLAWVFFRMPSLEQAVGIIVRMFTPEAMGVPSIVAIYGGSAPVLIIILAMAMLLYKEITEEFKLCLPAFVRTTVIRWAEYIVLFAMILSVGVLDGGSFIYVSF